MVIVLVAKAADTPLGMQYQPESNISLTLSGDNQQELTAYFDKLSAGGTVNQPLVQVNWGDTFGMCVDQFGVTWMVHITGPQK
jgi:PhnB protein